MATVPPPTATTRAASLTQIRAHIPITLNMEKMNYDSWRILFETHCLSFSLTGHIDGTSLPIGPTDATWKQLDNTVKMWIYGTISESLLNSVLKSQCSARELWLMLENLFLDNKEARAIQLENELRNLRIGDRSVHDYCQKLKSLSDTLANVDSPVSDRALVMHLLNGLSSKFDNIINVIKHRSPPCSFGDARSMLIEEESRLKTKLQSLPNNDDNASSPHVLLASSQQQDYCSVLTNQQFQGRGGGGNPNYNGGNWSSGNQTSTWPNQPQWPSYPQWPNMPIWPTTPPPPQFYGQPRFHIGSQPPTLPQRAQGILGHAPPSNGSAFLTSAQPITSPANTDIIPTTLANAFNTMTFSDPNDAGWYMDSAATAHLTAQPGTLSSITSSSNSSLPLVTVGNGSTIPVTSYGQTTIPSSSRPLHLNNVLICPQILKNLISVRQFTTDNLCSVEFDPFGFLVKDLRTRAPLIRCDSQGPLYSSSSTMATHLP
ncbi:hypothetical protein ISN44_As04g012080 [Arabidopsis suecica]|uniref:Retrovirus-related Pol polyprotein from transposon TNT 1-94-like beta-barrel domain-containing protein n=1 Tax=Arabidopsis suecica TaxID=45249 RepID=A0A8T2EKZ4_ARASU|nr:hypothetical protein ISN44_As04g012080 [Arabidopsis suecica]